MTGKKSQLDDVTAAVLKKVLAMPPKPHDQMKVGRTSSAKKRVTRSRAASAKPSDV